MGKSIPIEGVCEHGELLDKFCQQCVDDELGGNEKMLDPIPYLEKCKKHWQWLSENPVRSKIEYFKEFDIPSPKSGCYACQYVTDLRKEDREKPKMDCWQLCPIKWGEGGGCHSAEGSPYNQWYIAYVNGWRVTASEQAQRIVRFCDEAIEREVKNE